MPDDKDFFANIGAESTPLATQTAALDPKEDFFANVGASSQPAQSNPYEVHVNKAPTRQHPEQLKGNVQWFEDLKQAPYIGPIVGGAQQALNNAALSGREFKRTPGEAIPAAAVSGASGAVGAVEAPAALATNFLPNLVNPPEFSPQRNFPQQVAGTPEQQAQKVLQQSATQQAPSAYNRMVGGVPIARRISDFSAQHFPNVPGTRATAQTMGGLAVPVRGLNILNRAPGLNNLARGALEGAAIGEMYNMGNQAAEGQKVQPSITPALGGALIGAGLHTPPGKFAAKAVGKTAGFATGKVGDVLGVNKPREAPAEVAPEQQPTEEPVKAPAQKKISEVTKPQKKVQFRDAQEAIDALYGKSKEKQEAALDYLKQTQGGKAYEEPTRLQGHIEENVPQEEAPANSKLEAIYKKTGRQPTDVESEEITPEQKQNRFLKQARVPVEQVDEGGRSKKEDKGKPFDTANTKPREAWVTIDGVRKKHLVEPTEFDEQGKVTHVRAHAQTAGRSSLEKAEIQRRALTDKSSLASRLSAEELLSGQAAKAQGRAEQAKEDNEIREDQGEAVAAIARSQADIQKGIGTVNSNDIAAIDKFLSEEHGSATPDYPFAAISVGAKKTGMTPVEVARQLFGKNWVEDIKDTLKFHSTMDDIHEGSQKMGLDVHEKLIANRDAEALDKLIANARAGKIEEGAAEEEAKEALRRLSPKEIIEEPDHTPSLNDAQRESLATTKVYRMDSKKIIRDALVKNGDTMPRKFRDALKEYSEQQYGYTSPIKYHAPLEGVLGGINKGVYTGLFRNNPAFAGMVLSHTPQVGPSVLGANNLIKAYDLVLNDPTTKEFLESAGPLVEDPASQSARQMAGEQYGIVKKINEATLPGFKEDLSEKAGELNNKFYLIGGILKGARRIYGEGKAEAGLKKLAEYIKDPEGSSMDRADALQMLNQGLTDLNRGTGGGNLGMDLSMGQRTPYIRTYAQLSRYKGTLNRLYSRYVRDIVSGSPEAKAAAVAGLSTLMGMNVLIGGHSGVIPKEVEKPLFGILGPKNMLAIESALDQFNLLAKVPIVGTNLNDHIQPALWNWATNVATETAAQTATKLNNIWNDSANKPIVDRWADFLGHALLMIPIAIGGIGSGTWARGVKEYGNVLKGKKKLNVYATTGLLPESHPIATGTMKYDIGDFLHTLLLPGVENREYNFRQAKRLAQLFKQTGHANEIPTNLDKDIGEKGKPGYMSAIYPHEGIESGWKD